MDDRLCRLVNAQANYACTVGTVTPDSEVGIGLNMMATGETDLQSPTREYEPRIHIAT